MNEDDVREIIAELLRRKEEEDSRPDILEHTFAQQKRFITDPAKLKALFCTRRSAKSFTAGLYLVKEAIANPGCNCLFVGLTRASAKAIIWKDILRVIDSNYQIGASFNQSELTMTFPNGSVIYVGGIDVDESEMLKFLGRKYRLACIDEASMYTINLHNFVYGILAPAMVDPSFDNESGTICLMGTASDFSRGLFYDITLGKEGGWKLFTWTAHDNPYVAAKWQEALEKIRTDRPAYMETPQFKQWYLNEWVVDEDKLVYKFNAEKNLLTYGDWQNVFARHHHDGWSFVLGNDTGWEDASACVLTAYHIHNPHLYIIDSYRRQKMTFDDLIRKIQEFMADVNYPVHRVIIDGANKQGVESMRFRSNIPFEYADKKDKATFIELLNSDLIEGKIKIVNTEANRPLWQEMMALVWVTDGDKVKLPKKEHPSLQNHLCDAFLYAWRCGYHYSHTKAMTRIVKYSPAWYKEQQEGIWEREREHLEKLYQQTEWPDQGTLGELG